jgi:DNA-binding NarL/FixJ family response regulator
MDIGLFLLLRDRIFADALAIGLDREPDLDVVAALDASALPRVVVGSRVGVVLLDAELADDAAFRLSRETSQAAGAPRVILLSHSRDPEEIVRAIRAGADGWVAKDEPITRLIEVIRGVALGETLLPQDQTGEVLRLLARRRDRDEEGDDQLLTSLTDREREVLLCLAEGIRRGDVAKRLQISPHTVRTHLQNLMAKLGVHTTLEAVTLTRRLHNEDLSAGTATRL